MSTDDDLAEWYERWVGTHSMREAFGTFDGVVCFMALMDIPDLAQRRGPSPAQRMGCLSLLHPCFHTSQSGEMDSPEAAEVPAVLVVGCRKGTSKQGEYYAVAERKTRAWQICKRIPPKELQQYLARVCQERGWTKDSSSEKFVLFIEEVGERGLCHAQGGWAV